MELQEMAPLRIVFDACQQMCLIKCNEDVWNVSIGLLWQVTIKVSYEIIIQHRLHLCLQFIATSPIILDPL